MNLATQYPGIYWAAACLTANARYGLDNESIFSRGESGEQEGEELSGLDNSPLEGETDEIRYSIKKTSKVDYGKISKAISNAQMQGVRVTPPDINNSRQDFKPDVSTNTILFGLGGVKGIGDEVVSDLISGRPYNDLEDFYTKMDGKITLTATLTIIKSGMFDNLEKNKTREQLVEQYLYWLVSKEKSTNKEKLTMVNFNKLCDINCVPEGLERESKHYYFRDWLKKHTLSAENKTEYVFSDDQLIRYFKVFFEGDLEIDKDYQVIEGVYILDVKAFEKVYKNKLSKVSDWLKEDTSIEFFNESLKLDYIRKTKEKYCQGNNSTWEMDTLGFYYSGHELEGVKMPYKVDEFKNLPIEPEMTVSNNGKEYPVNTYIMGTVVDFDKTKKIVTINTLESGPVDIKFFSSLYNAYGLQLSEVNNKGVKKVVDKSWFSKGNKLVVNGFRRGDVFNARKNYGRREEDFTIGFIEILDNEVKIRYNRK